MSGDILGSEYDCTFGELLDYRALAAFVAGQFREDTSFLDLACGTGRLLEEIERQGGWELAGVDEAEEQLEIARKRLGTARLYCGDILAPKLLHADVLGRGWCAHLGFAFMNRLAAERRRAFFRRWHEHTKVGRIGVEIWSLRHQLAVFLPNVWHRRDLAGGTLRSRCTHADSTGREIKLEMVFCVDGQELRSEARMYRFDEDELISDAEAGGWRVEQVAAAEYRGGQGDSHTFVRFSR